MKAYEMREMTADELVQHRDGLVEEMINLKIKLAVKQLDNALQVRTIRREIARANTVLTQKARGAKPGEVAGKKD